MGRVFANDLGDRGSISGQVIPKTKKIVIYATLLNTQHYKVQIKGKVRQSREWSSTLLPSWFSSYWKGSLWVAFNYGFQFYIIYIFQTIVLIFDAMFITSFRPLYAPAFFRWLECQT